MPRKKLSAIAISTLPPGNWPDPIVPGLMLRVGANRRTWTYRYRTGGKNPRLTLGHHPKMGLQAARDAARAAAERIDGGAMPVPSEPHPRSAGALSLGALIDKYERLRTTEGGRIKSLPEAMSSLRRNLKRWLPLPAVQFSKADLRVARDEAAKNNGMIAANRLLAYLGPVMRWAAEEDLITASFVSAIRRAPEQKRKRKLTNSEIAAIWHACDDLGAREAASNYGRMVRFLLVTAQRRDEAASLRHGDILDRTWRQVTNKSDRPHSIPLPPLALSLVGRGEARDLVFAGRSGKLSGYSKLKQALDEASGIEGWVLHDLRRSAASRMQDLGVPNHVVGSILNHAIVGVGAHYLQAELEKQKAEALAIWAVALTKVAHPTKLVVG
jgi:integrase